RLPRRLPSSSPLTAPAPPVTRSLMPLLSRSSFTTASRSRVALAVSLTRSPLSVPMMPRSPSPPTSSSPSVTLSTSPRSSLRSTSSATGSVSLPLTSPPTSSATSTSPTRTMRRMRN
ncbi:hypothetical protein BGW38_007925, partial [Lunasporangiospora selenospora]